LRKALQDTTAVAKQQIFIKQTFKVYKIVKVVKEAELKGAQF